MSASSLLPCMQDTEIFHCYHVCKIPRLRPLSYGPGKKFELKPQLRNLPLIIFVRTQTFLLRSIRLHTAADKSIGFQAIPEVMHGNYSLDLAVCSAASSPAPINRRMCTQLHRRVRIHDCPWPELARPLRRLNTTAFSHRRRSCQRGAGATTRRTYAAALGVFLNPAHKSQHTHTHTLAGCRQTTPFCAHAFLVPTALSTRQD